MDREVDELYRTQPGRMATSPPPWTVLRLHIADLVSMALFDALIRVAFWIRDAQARRDARVDSKYRLGGARLPSKARISSRKGNHRVCPSRGKEER
jgi:hypothetical protein